jgi:hypothetical protein
VQHIPVGLLNGGSLANHFVEYHWAFAQPRDV